MWKPGYAHEEVLTNPQYDHDPRAVRLRKECKRCGAARGIYCRTSGGYQTLHKTRGR